jgi:hypothetical protein
MADAAIDMYLVFKKNIFLRMEQIRRIHQMLDNVTSIMWRRVSSLMERGETMQSLEIKSAALEETSRIFASHVAPPPTRFERIKRQYRFYLEWFGFFACPCLPCLRRLHGHEKDDQATTTTT